MTLVLRTAADPVGFINPVRNLVWSFNKDLVIGEEKTLEQVLSQALWQQRFNMVLIGLLALLALTLVIVGIYGVMAYTVTQRTHEIGIRMALGAQMRDVLSLLRRQGLTRALIGVSIGRA